MPQQLKIIVGPNYEPNAPFTVNFNTPVIVKPGNKITLDKFTANIKNITSNFALPDSPFTFFYGLNFPNFQSSTVTVPGRTYTSILDLLNTMNQLINNTFTAYQFGYLPVAYTRIYRDEGLKVYCSTTNTSSGTVSSTTNVFQIQYNTSSYVKDTTVASLNMTVLPGGFAAPEADGIWTIGSSTKLLQGGGIRLTFQLNTATDVEAQGNNMIYVVGVTSTTGLFHGLQQNNLGELYLVYGPIAGPFTATEIDNDKFVDSVNGEPIQYYFDMYQVNGQWAVRFYSRDTDDITIPQTEIYNSNNEDPGALGAFDITQTYEFTAGGTSQNIQYDSPQINVETIYSIPDIDLFNTPPDPVENRTIAFDMSNAGPLRSGLDIPSGQMLLTPTNSYFGAFKCQGSINMSVINSAFDIAIEILDLPLQTFQASSDRQPGNRVNIVSYFHPELSNIGSGTYIYDSRANVWLDIDITYPVNLSSLSFRVYDPATGVGINASAMTFNLLISTTEY